MMFSFLYLDYLRSYSRVRCALGVSWDWDGMIAVIRYNRALREAIRRETIRRRLSGHN